MSEADLEYITKFTDYPELLPSAAGVYIGGHFSLPNIFSEMKRLNATGAALFVSQPESWLINLRQLSASAKEFYEYADRNGFKRDEFLPHGPYLLNLMSTRENVRERSLERLVSELYIVRMMGLNKLNIHPGTGDEERPEYIADAINTALGIVPDVIVVLETMAGNLKGSCYGCSFEQLKKVIDLIDDEARIGVCIDTQHTFAGGFVEEEGFAVSLIQEFDEVIGRQYLCGFHVNNSLTEYNSHVDRHAPLESGRIKLENFRKLMGLKIESVYCLETTDSGMWEKEIELLKEFSK